MTREEHLLVIAMEECAEIQHRISKALRFGLTQTEKDKDINNAERIYWEICDLLAVTEMLQEALIIPTYSKDSLRRMIFNHQEKIEKFLKHSRLQGRLNG